MARQMRGKGDVHIPLKFIAVGRTSLRACFDHIITVRVTSFLSFSNSSSMLSSHTIQFMHLNRINRSQRSTCDDRLLKNVVFCSMTLIWELFQWSMLRRKYRRGTSDCLISSRKIAGNRARMQSVNPKDWQTCDSQAIRVESYVRHLN